jgi:hypothetical protein
MAATDAKRVSVTLSMGDWNTIFMLIRLGRLADGLETLLDWGPPGLPEVDPNRLPPDVPDDANLAEKMAAARVVYDIHIEREAALVADLERLENEIYKELNNE